MKVHIDKHGYLHLEKRGRIVMQNCPYNSGMACGELCPLFNVGEAIAEGENHYSTPHRYVHLCDDRIRVDETDYSEEPTDA